MTLRIQPHVHDIGFPVRRVLPARERQRVGPFIFFDHMGPAQFATGTTREDVRPHPHIGLATVTYLYAGAMLHRDSLGVVQRIEPGAINLMTAGRGIVHSERFPDDIRASGARVEGIQTWLALPLEYEETAPAFAHHPATALPQLQRDGVGIRVLMGHAFGRAAPVATLAPTLYVDLQMAAGAELALDSAVAEERAVYVASGAPLLNGETLPTFSMTVLDADAVYRLQAGPDTARVMLLGGATLPGARHLHWNLVSSRRERIATAREDWRAGRFAQVPGETEFIPLPDAPDFA